MGENWAKNSSQQIKSLFLWLKWKIFKLIFLYFEKIYEKTLSNHTAVWINTNVSYDFC